MASTVAASTGVKKYQPSGFTGRGGAPENGDQGTLPEIVLPSAVAAKIGNAATEANRRRRLKPRKTFSINPSGLRIGKDAAANSPWRFSFGWRRS
jgi:hypothetical protein